MKYLFRCVYIAFISKYEKYFLTLDEYITQIRRLMQKQ